MEKSCDWRTRRFSSTRRSSSSIRRFTTVPSFFQTVLHAIFILDTLFTTTKYFCPKTSNESMVLDILAALDDFLVLEQEDEKGGKPDVDEDTGTQIVVDKLALVASLDHSAECGIGVRCGV